MSKRLFAVKHKFIFSCLMASLWLILVCWINSGWITQFALVVGWPFSVTAIVLIAIMPSFWYAFTLASFLVDNRPEDPEPASYPGVTVLMSAYNEEAGILHAVRSLAAQQYPGELEIIILDDGSTDNTLSVLKSVAATQCTVVARKHHGKAATLNAGVAMAKHELIITVDADTHLLPNSIKRIVQHLLASPSDTAAVAGCVCVKNSRDTIFTKMQEWNYFNEYTSQKRIQSLFQGALVAQGAFSIYRKSAIHEAGGFPDCLGEDIVLTWGILKLGYRVGFAEQAYAFTLVPSTYKSLFYQRSRWSAGMLEALRAHPSLLFKARMSTLFVWWDLFIPLIDFGYAFIFLPGVILACMGYFYIAGPMTLSIIPLVLLNNYIYFYRSNKIFEKNKLITRKNALGLFVFMFLYQPLVTVPSAIHGYFTYFFKKKRRWGAEIEENLE